jgi:hypothetical protein
MAPTGGSFLHIALSLLLCAIDYLKQEKKEKTTETTETTNCFVFVF